MLETLLVAITGLLLAGVAVVLTSALEFVVLTSAGHPVPFDAGLPALLVAAALVAVLMALATAVAAVANLRRSVPRDGRREVGGPGQTAVRVDGLPGVLGTRVWPPSTTTL